MELDLLKGKGKGR